MLSHNFEEIKSILWNWALHVKYLERYVLNMLSAKEFVQIWSMELLILEIKHVAKCLHDFCAKFG